MSSPSSRRPASPEAPSKTDEASENDTQPSLATFEEASARLATIVDELERGDLPLERSLLLFEEGVKLARAAQARIVNAERRVEELLGVDPNGRPVTREIGRDSDQRGPRGGT